MFELFVGMDAISKHGQRRSDPSDTARGVDQQPSRLRAASARVLRTAARPAAEAQSVDRRPSGERSAAVDCSPVN
jgi:hypothetical protein